MANKCLEGSAIAMTLNIKIEIVKLGMTGSHEKAIALKQFYVDGWEIDPEMIYIHHSNCPIETGRWGAIFMDTTIGNQEYVIYSVRILDDFETCPLVILNNEFDRLLVLTAREPQLAFLFLRTVFAGKLKYFLRGLLPVDS